MSGNRQSKKQLLEEKRKLNQENLKAMRVQTQERRKMYERNTVGSLDECLTQVSVSPSEYIPGVSTHSLAW